MMKTIKWSDLKFEKHPRVENGVMCKFYCDNGEWISIVGGKEFLYGDGVTTFEILSSSTEKTKRIVKGWLSKTQVLRHLNYLNKKGK